MVHPGDRADETGREAGQGERRRPVPRGDRPARPERPHHKDQQDRDRPHRAVRFTEPGQDALHRLVRDVAETSDAVGVPQCLGPVEPRGVRVHPRRQGRGGEGDEDGSENRPPAERRHQADAEQAEHDGVVVGARDQVQQDERVEGAEPQGGGRVGTAVPCEAGQRGRHQGHAGEGDEPHAEQPGGQFAVGQTRQPRRDGEEHRAVRGARVRPQRGDSSASGPPSRDGPCAYTSMCASTIAPWAR